MAGEEEREVQKSYWMEHSRDLTVEAMMLDSRATELDKEERPEVSYPSNCLLCRVDALKPLDEICDRI